MERELACIIRKYANVLNGRGIKVSFNFDAFSKFNKDFEKALDDAYDYISNAANDGDIDAEKTLVKIDELLDYDYPNYFVIQGDSKANMQAAEFGDVFSQGMLGDRYYYGKGFEKDYSKAVYWYRIAAGQGVALAQYNLAGCYELGRGIEKDKGKALEWYKYAASHGVHEAKRTIKRIELEKSLTEDELLPYKPTYIWEGEREKSWKDEYGVEYSKDGKRLLDAPSDIKEYIIKDGTRVICDGAFCRCKELSSIIIPESVVAIGGWAFNGCQSLKKIKLPVSLREIGESAFQDTGLQLADIPDNVISIGDTAFSGCSDLQILIISKNVEDIGIRVVAWNKNLKTIRVSTENKHYDSRCDCNAIIDTKRNQLIAGCGATAIPETVASIGEGAFFGCGGLKMLEIPYGITSIGRECFLRCENLESVSLPSSIQTIEERAFWWCKKLKTVVMRQGLKNIGDGVFIECTSLESCDLPEGLETIGRTAFERCCRLTRLVIPDSVTRIGTGAFRDCDGLKSVSISKSIKKIDSDVFLGCTGIYTVQIPNGVKIIGKNAFQYCKGLDSIVLPDSVALIEAGAFDDCGDINVYLQTDHIEMQSAENANNMHQSSTTRIKDIVSRIRHNGISTNEQ